MEGDGLMDGEEAAVILGFCEFVFVFVFQKVHFRVVSQWRSCRSEEMSIFFVSFSGGKSR